MKSPRLALAFALLCLSAFLCQRSAASAAPAAEGGKQQVGRLPSDALFSDPDAAAHRFDDFRYQAKERQEEAAEKLSRVRKWLASHRYDALVISTQTNFEWMTAGGKDTVIWAQRESPVKLLITPEKLTLVASNIDGPRVMDEELGGLGYDWVSFQWYEEEHAVLAPLLKKKKVVFDSAATAAAYQGDPVKDVTTLQDVYFPITHGELLKYRWLGHKTAEVLEQVAQVIRPGMTERDVQYLLEREFWYWDIFPTVVLSAADERYRDYRQPVVQGRTIRNYVGLDVCARRWGLVVSTTRVVFFGQPDAALVKAWQEGPKVMAAMWSASRSGSTLGEVVKAAQDTYAHIGYQDEWKVSDQGGPILTRERLFAALPGDKTKIEPGMVLAWNPTVAGAKFEDTVVVKEGGGLENLTPPLKWPSVSVRVGSVTYTVPTLMLRSTPE